MSTFVDVLREQPELFAKAQALSARAHDSNEPGLERLQALLELSDLAAPAVLEATRRNLAAGEAKPQYRFVNGAKVRVKST